MVDRELVVFTLDEQRYALPLSAVERIVRLLEVTTLPEAPEIVLGVINVQGRIVPVLDIRRRFHLAARETHLSDHIILAHTPVRPVALLVETVQGLLPIPQEEWIPAETIVPGTRYVAGVAKLKDGIILIHDLENFLSLEEEHTLDSSLSRI